MDELERTSVYKYYDQIGILIYVGITNQESARNKQHNASKHWWHFVARQDVSHHESREGALAEERRLIQKHLPPFNVQHNAHHVDIKSAYLKMVQSVDLSTSLFDAGMALKNKLPVVVWSRDGNKLMLISLADNAVVATRLRHIPGAKVVGMGEDYHGNVVGTVANCYQAGPFAVIELVLRKNVTFESAVVNFTNQKDGYLINKVRLLGASIPKRSRGPHKIQLSC